MQNRIQVNGIWYVREEEREPIEIIEYKCLMYENEKFVFEASIDEEKHKLDLIEITDKQVKPWKERCWDNLDFLKICLEYDETAHQTLESYGFNKDDIETFIAFLKEIQKKGYL